ncbi:TonB-dependent receptor [Novosphingobium pokkalii]|nr:TonB-dependent receptor [Novosphingobium pokkalii]
MQARGAKPQSNRGTRRALMAFALLAGAALAHPALADQAAPAPAPETDGDKPEIVVSGSLGALPLKDVGSVFGFDKTLAETPRAASSVSSEQLERFGITQIYDLVSQVPGTFTSSFFGTGGALDIRGTPGEVYFRGMLRLENPGNYPTPIAAADRIDIVRGPASPIYGPSKTGGYMNFVPKTARAANGTYAPDPHGFISYDTGSWARSVLKGSITGPGKIGDHQFGYSLYAESEDSGSYYRNIHPRNLVLSAAFDTDITSNLRTEFGGMYQKFRGQQNGGWNRLTQDLVDNGTYITGNASSSIDTNGDGQISRSEAYAANGGRGLTMYGSFACGGGTAGASGITDACLKANYPDLALVNPGKTTLSKRDTLTGPNDKLNNDQKTFYFDLIWTGPGKLEIKNQLFYDGTKNLNENYYGFSQKIDSYVLEDKIVLSDSFTTSAAKISVQAAPSLRYTKFNFADDFGVELWNRVDITTGYTAASTRQLSTDCDCNYSDYVKGHYLDVGLAGLVDVDFDFGLDVIGGLRWDHVHATSRAILDKYDPVDRPTTAGTTQATGNDSGLSWNGSISYRTPIGLIPYFTASRQSTVVAGEGAEIEPGAISGGTFLSASRLYEAGIKGEFLDKRLYAAVSVYKQERTDLVSDSPLTNQSIRTKGVEAELRWAIDKHALVTANYTYIDVVNISALTSGGYFNYFGIADLVNVSDPSLYLGGSQFGALYPKTNAQARRPGIPHNVVSATGTYAFDNGLALNADVSHVDSVFSSYSQNVRLPAYWLVNAGASFTTGPWMFRAVVKNLNNARYFRAGGQDLFGADIALPQVPRNFQATIQYKF